MTEPVKSGVAARSADHAEELIAELVVECRLGLSDREREAIALAELWGLETDPIHEDFAEARAFCVRVEAQRPKPLKVGRIISPAQFNRRRITIETKAPEVAKPPVAPDREAMLAADALIAKKRAEELFISPPTQPQAEPESEKQSLGALTVIEPQGAIIPADETPEETAVREMNDKHAVISNLGGKCVIMEWVPSAISEGQKELAYQSFQAFRERYANQYVMVPKGRGQWESKPSAPHWLGHPNRRQYEGLDLVPNGPRVLPNGYLNLWRGWGVEPRKGSWKLIERHIAEVLANGSQEFEDYIKRSTAWKFQNAGLPMEVVLALLGGKGAGKGAWGYILMLIFGSHGLQIFSTDHLIGKHNQHLQNKLELFLDEAIWAGDKDADRVLKGLTTEKFMFIEPKNINGFQWLNRLGIYMSGNDKWIVPASHDERRYAVNKVSEKWKQNRDYFGPLFEEINNGGAAAMLHDMLAMDLDGWHPRDHVPQTKALLDQKMMGLTGLEKWFVHLLNVGQLPGATEKNPRFALSTNLLRNAKQHVAQNKYATFEEQADFLKEMGCIHKSNGRARGWVFPPLADARAAWCIRSAGDWQFLADVADWSECASPLDETLEEDGG